MMSPKLRPCCADLDIPDLPPKAKPIHESMGEAVFMLPDEEHVVKEGPTDLIAWEYQAYNRVQEVLHFPKVCERFLDVPRRRKGLLLHWVVCFRDIFTGETFPRPSEPFSHLSTALCASHLIHFMRLMHYNDVLHRDIHPGGVGFLCAPSGGLPAKMEELEEIYKSGFLFTLAFIDYEWSTMNGYHPRGIMPTMTMWPYLSDRVLREPGKYSAADDLEALAYTLLDFHLRGKIPWGREIEARSSPYYYDLESAEHRDFVIRTRTRYLEELYNTPSSSSHSIEKCLLDFIQYARSLERNDRVDYVKWEDVFEDYIRDYV